MFSQILVTLEITHVPTSFWLGAGIRWPQLSKVNGVPGRVRAGGH